MISSGAWYEWAISKVVNMQQQQLFAPQYSEIYNNIKKEKTNNIEHRQPNK